MTRCGPDKIIECPKCKKLAKVFTLESGNTFGARWWTDGKMEAPMLPERPKITKCSGCNDYFWLSDAKDVSENFFYRWGRKREKEFFDKWCGKQVPVVSDNPMNDPDYRQEWKDADKVRELSKEEYLEAISLSVFSNKKQELFLRVKVWHANNDRFRLPRKEPVLKPQAIPSYSPEEKANLERLTELLDAENPDDRLLKAEAKREMGLFDEAFKLLDFSFPDEYKHTMDFIKFIAEHHDCVVREIG